ncbi:ribosome hibernation-promoting factor, HPF/YfiA family [Clostridium luticellarii]|jgi:putative sigma-54 modulation protein|uniref:Ribosome hibernation promoting factor n=1 Tax=Clostridium luticellarii TaxID=1691940 RepID=A0A2T0BQL1_9CLOT|nr:ribosome-associated translation inhibitor RaiA [Clostridium luticellarii]MCI1944800.1 ribosome-associated translation inhibitor RaiA [Clostridium luticellarii]MCI1968295.1 ribosome-associated translation inhibitor RaiA [Clostridium luticellarii]MCI1995668.1 ribosome-associated translation inhibitor RaiA [Clostridium luticellarii]MCI2040252.1 ribosome-associated translation inhibitor RaiA [Clostridium luticellarii]PRR86170.1 Ribosome-associated factor Y [Clostridium luticellarii]
MKITVTGKNIVITDALKSVVRKKLSRLDKYFNPDVEAHATLSVQKNRQKIEVTIPFNGVILRGEEENGDMYASIDLVLDKLEGQIRKQKTKLLKRNNSESLRFQFIPNDVEEDEEEHKIVRTKKFAVKPMSSEEAVLQMELLGHSFFVYRDAENGEVNVVYRRRDGNYGLIEPEF